MEELPNNSVSRGKSFLSMIVDILKFIGCLILAQIPTTIIMMLFNIPAGTNELLKYLLAALWIFFTVVLIFFLWQYYAKHSKYPIQKIGLKDVGIAVLLYLLMRVIVIAGTFLMAAVYSETTTANDEAIRQMSNPATIFPAFYLLYWLTIGIVAPILEELSFRGIFVNLFCKKYTKWVPAIITSVIFSVNHLSSNLISFAMYFMMGIVFFFAYYRRHNIVDSIIVHVLNNGVIAIIMLLQYSISFM